VKRPKGALERFTTKVTKGLMSAILASTLRALRVQFYHPDKIVANYRRRI